METTSDYELLARDIRRKAELIRSSLPAIQARAIAVAAQIGRPPSRIYLVGCGDSLNVGMACRFELERALGIPVEAVPALTFSRYSVEAAPDDALVIALSQSGKVARVVEAVRRGRESGLRTVSLTGSAQSALAREPADAVIVTNFEGLGFVPGTTSFAFNMALVFELGAALAEVWGRPADTLARLRSQVALAPDLLARSLEPAWEVARRHANEFGLRRPMLILGTGPNFATALYLARKMFEIPQIVALTQETEEYAHDAYSVVTSDTPAWVFVPPDAAEGRSREILESVLNLGCPTAVVTESGATNLDKRVRYVYELEPGLGETMNPLLYALPGDVFTYELVKEIGGSFYASEDPVHASAGDALIYQSEIV